jgi:hypothetical protein
MNDIEALFFLICLLIKGSLPWKYKIGDNLVNHTFMHGKVNEMKYYFNDFEV